jgi:hypothetical protein
MGLQFARQLQPVHARQVDVQQDHVRAVFTLLQKGEPVLRGDHQISPEPFLLEEVLRIRPIETVILNDKDMTGMM